MTLAAQIARALAPLGTPQRAIQEKAYLKSDLVHLGVTVPKVRAAVKALAKAARPDHAALITAVEQLWSQRIYELRSSAVELLVLGVAQLGPGDLPLLERLLREAKTWALVDFLAPHVVGALAVRHAAVAKLLDRWAKDDDFWLRRAAMLALLVPLREGGGDFARFGRYADALLEDKQFFIRKAIGWILREVSHDRPELVVDWLAPRAHRAAGLTLREATKHLTAKQRAHVLAGATRR